MAYTEMAIEDQILLAIEFIGRGLEIPQEIRANLDPDLLLDIQHPEITSEPDTHGRPGSRSKGRAKTS